MGTTADKLNYLKDTKELFRQKLNNSFDINLTVSDQFRQYSSRIDSSQLWMDAWIGGSVKYFNYSYEGSDRTNLSYRCFGTLTAPNMTKLTNVIADTVIMGGPSSVGSTVLSDCEIDSLYLTNATRVSYNDSFGSIAPGSVRLHLPKVTSVKGKSLMSSVRTWAINGCEEVYLPVISVLDRGAISGGSIHIGTGSCTLDSKGLYNVTAIYVPASSVASYKAATNWSSWADKIYAEPGT